MRAINQAIDSGQLTFEKSFLKPLTLEDTKKTFMALCDLGSKDLLNEDRATCDTRANYGSTYVVLLIVLRHNLWYNTAKCHLSET